MKKSYEFPKVFIATLGIAQYLIVSRNLKAILAWLSYFVQVFKP